MSSAESPTLEHLVYLGVYRVRLLILGDEQLFLGRRIGICVIK
jgi:hypothetical protein